MSSINGNGNSDESYTHRVSDTYNGKMGPEESRQDVVYSKVRGSAVSGGNSVGNNLHKKNTGDSGRRGGAS